jgi:ribonuclease HIII
MLDREALFGYWQHDCEPSRASQIIQDALYEPPTSAKDAARALQIAHRGELAPAWERRVADELEPHLNRLRLRLGQVDAIGDLNSEPSLLFEILGDEAEALQLEGFDSEALRVSRLGAPRALAAEHFFNQLGREALPEPAAGELARAIRDLRDQIRRGEAAQALLVGFEGEGFVVGLQLALGDGADISTQEQVTPELHVAAKTALKEVLDPEQGARYGMEWSLRFEGPSIGVPMALAGLTAAGYLDPDPLTGATGKIEAGGAITGVGGIEPKLRAARAAGLRRVILPAQNEAEARALGIDDLDLRFVEHVRDLRRAVSIAGTSAEFGIAAKKRLLRTLARPIAGFELVGEAAIDHGYQFKLASLRGKATITLYNSGSVVVGASPPLKPALEDFVGSYLRDPAPEPRGSLVLQLPSSGLQEEAYLAIADLGVDAPAPNAHESWRLKLVRGKSTATAVLYSTGKLVVQGTAPAHDELREALKPAVAGLSGSELLAATPAAQRVKERREKAQGDTWIGTDESGKGDYFGPLVSAGVYLDQKLAKRLEALGVRDSKKLSDKRVHELAPALQKLLGRRARTTVINPRRYNELYSEFRSEGKNLNSLLAWGHYRSVIDLLNAGAAPGYVIVDQFADARYIEERLSKEAQRRDIEILQYPRAETDVAVAAASILAREGFLRWLQRESAQIGFTLPKGAGDIAVNAARALVDTFGEMALGEYAKVSFRTTERVLA